VPRGRRRLKPHPSAPRLTRYTRRRLLAIGLLWLALAPLAAAQEATLVHGLWVWKGATVLGTARGAEQLRDFCRAQGINEVYVAVFSHGELDDAAALVSALALLHHGGIRVEALLSSTDADESGRHRDKLLAQVRTVVQFNQQHPHARIDGIHLDIEPQQRAQNKGPGNLRFLPGLVEAYAAVRALAQPAGLTVNADIQNKLLKGSLEERSSLMHALPRLTLMLYELSSPTDGSSSADKAAKLRTASRSFLDMAYAGVPAAGLATMVIALRTPDYGELLPQMLKTLDAAFAREPHYQGWARHSYNDTLSAAAASAH
jgi:hypothetical protein